MSETMLPPKLPSRVSSDGREIWDWAARLSDHIHRQDELRRLANEIAEVGTQCGDCNKWMKSRECPREKNINGRNHGPSMGSPVCGAFVENALASKHREKLQAERSSLSGEGE